MVTRKGWVLFLDDSSTIFRQSFAPHMMIMEDKHASYAELGYGSPKECAVLTCTRLPGRRMYAGAQEEKKWGDEEGAPSKGRNLFALVREDRKHRC